MKLYIAGKITDDPEYQAKFNIARSKFPADAVLLPSVLPDGLRKGDYMRVCLAMIDTCDKVAFLPDWKESPGAKLEHEYCRYILKPVIYL